MASLVEDKRFNDPITADALKCLRKIHKEIGEIIEAVDCGNMIGNAIYKIEENRQKLNHSLKEGAKLSIVAPTMTLGVMHILTWLTGISVDSTLVSTVFGAIVGADALKEFSKTHK